ncbi:hypothetical protein EMIHUDRAFT_459025 [Emiliania huxleyi CCMP1516]|uniref:Uncharacterized protein n=2 Tax=Emiliania huxleyi TaxID=2903 RepID=A0A0D3J0Z1_EMIH1|nr:hypothetical protein EMIHUDRAFT_459025 [Emiliania huxleyi CCMP1516]EOD17176.1 hypothetical protein EMIHUDRAFT_459025 [Emiliania huxleyi CCMP1516]|eukprot:XP_005769605.1 hypothetical protein EMIHUDRAFT_459025 [Emiliania huxleyi CCMP1516]
MAPGGSSGERTFAADVSPGVPCELQMYDSGCDGWDGITWSGLGQEGLTLHQEDCVPAGSPSAVVVEGTLVGVNEWLVLMPAGSKDCDGATQARSTQGGQMSANGSVPVWLPAAGTYKVCHSSQQSPDDDGDFVLVSHVLQKACLPPNAPPAPPTSDEAVPVEPWSTTATVAYTVAATVGVCAAALSPSPRATFAGRPSPPIARQS